MNYTLEEIYALAGKDDKTALVTFKSGSDANKEYGEYLTLLFIYTQDEREDLDEKIKSPSYTSSGYAKARYLGFDLEPEKVDKLKTDGINSDDISLIQYYNAPSLNTFHSKEKRTIKKLNIPLKMQKKGRDLDWMYGFAKKYVSENIGLSPKEREFYLAGKLYYEAEQLTPEEKKEAFDDQGNIKEGVEWELLSIKYQRDEISDTDKIRMNVLYKEKKLNNISLLDKYLKESGSSFKKLSKLNFDLAADIFSKIHLFRERRLNIVGPKAIYLDVDRYLHIYMRHVEEMKINDHFKMKDNFQWNEEDVLVVIKKVIENLNDEIQLFFANKPGKRFSRYGKHSYYFEGDYYTFHIEADGRVSTFHKNKKKTLN
ncbi:MAG: hypothetical protein WAU23_03770 [Ferruginibacter sp.]